MKPLTRLAFISFLGFLLWNCDDDSENPSKKQFKVSEFQSISIGGNAVVNLQPNAAAAGSAIITVEGNPALASQFKVDVINGVLHIDGSDQVVIADGITVVVPVSDLYSITLEADQEAEVVWEEADENTTLENVAIKLEANSKLALLGLQIRNIDIQQEAQSQLYLNSQVESGGEFKIAKADVEFVNDTTAIVNDEAMWYVETSTVVMEDDVEYYVFSGEKTRAFYIAGNVNAVLQATSNMQATECPAYNVDIRLEGQSTAYLHVIQNLSGKGEGESTLYYYGNPTVAYDTQGSAQIVGL